jgi:hypothetical protein
MRARPILLLLMFTLEALAFPRAAAAEGGIRLGAMHIGEDEDARLPNALQVRMLEGQPAPLLFAEDAPRPLIWINLQGCIRIAGQEGCVNMPRLLLAAEEMPAGSSILSIEGRFASKSFRCPGTSCPLDLHETDLDGDVLQFWGNLANGEKTDYFFAQVRVLPPEEGIGWRVEVLSDQWLGEPLPACASIWEVFPPAYDVPRWLQTPQQVEDLATEAPYAYLAGKLIIHGLVDASHCAMGGVLANGYANSCGMISARELVNEWQNMFDARILQAARRVGIPAVLLKNLFAVESQFWPGYESALYEAGLGRLFAVGADVLLLWRPDFFSTFCLTQLDATVCQKGYINLSAQTQALLRGAVVSSVRADCPECPMGIDLARAQASVDIFADLLVANCIQASQGVWSIMKSPPGVFSYEDLWRLTLLNYSAGPGCFYQGVRRTKLFRDERTWESVASHLTLVCAQAIPYVDAITAE